MITIRELAPRSAGRSDGGVVAVLRLVVLQEAYEHHGFRREVVVYAEDFIVERAGLGEDSAEVVAAVAGRIEREA